mmetsp:Transcript_9263/g.15868  ORF Transcript_9263/g.15868 Transcript_9263/m.15868 type:complete len:129 (-) Transcript_9263:961-1347(-)
MRLGLRSSAAEAELVTCGSAKAALLLFDGTGSVVACGLADMSAGEERSMEVRPIMRWMRLGRRDELCEGSLAVSEEALESSRVLTGASSELSFPPRDEENILDKIPPAPPVALGKSSERLDPPSIDDL